MFIDTDSSSIQMYWNCLLFLLQQQLLFKTYNHASMNFANLTKLAVNNMKFAVRCIQNNKRMCSFYRACFTEVMKIIEKTVKKKFNVSYPLNIINIYVHVGIASIRQLPSAPTTYNDKKNKENLVEIMLIKFHAANKF